MKSLAIIPARSGSKGLPDKNIKELFGIPLLAYSIKAATDSGVFSEIMVSTDSEKYADIAKKWGANVPFLRSEKNSSDVASSWDMVKEVLENYKQMGMTFDMICLLQPTSPLRTADDIINAYKIFSESQTAVVSVCEVDHSPLWCNHLPANNSLDGFITRNNNTNRQSNGLFYRINGAIYMVNVEELYKDTFLYREGSYAYIMDKSHSVDIDTEFDFKMAEFLLNSDSNNL